MTKDRIVAVGLLTRHDLEMLGAEFNRYFPVSDEPCFADLIAAIDEADRTQAGAAQGRSHAGAQQDDRFNRR